MNFNRRQFLRTTTAAALAFSAAPLLRAQSAGRKYRTALIGCGWWGNNILGEAMASGEANPLGLGGMSSKVLAARRMADAGIPTLIASGAYALPDILSRSVRSTRFHPRHGVR